MYRIGLVVLCVLVVYVGQTEGYVLGGLSGLHTPLPHHAVDHTTSIKEDTSFLQTSSTYGRSSCANACETCVFVLERLKKKGTNILPSAICSEMFFKFPQQYPCCKEVVNHLAINGNNIRYWLYDGCYMYENYMTKEWVNPCPSHVICNSMKSLDNQSFCKALPVQDPFRGE